MGEEYYYAKDYAKALKWVPSIIACFTQLFFSLRPHVLLLWNNVGSSSKMFLVPGFDWSTVLEFMNSTYIK